MAAEWAMLVTVFNLRTLGGRGAPECETVRSLISPPELRRCDSRNLSPWPRARFLPFNSGSGSVNPLVFR